MVIKTLINQSSEEAKVGMGESADSAQLRFLFFLSCQHLSSF